MAPAAASPSLSGKTAIITGAGRGIGRAIAHELSRAGCNVVLAARTFSEVEEVAAELNSAHQKQVALPIACDVSDEEQVQSMIASAVARFGGIDVIINNAGALLNKPLVEQTVAEWDNIVNGHVRGAFLVTRFALPYMLAAGWGRIITIASGAGHKGVPGAVSYCTAKWAQIGFTHAVDEELAASGIRAHVISPGPVATPLRQRAAPHENPAELIQPEDVAKQVLQLLTLPCTVYIRELILEPQ